MVEELRRLCLSKNDFDTVNIIGRGHFGQVRKIICEIEQCTRS